MSWQDEARARVEAATTKQRNQNIGFACLAALGLLCLFALGVTLSGCSGAQQQTAAQVALTAAQYEACVSEGNKEIDNAQTCPGAVAGLDAFLLRAPECLAVWKGKTSGIHCKDGGAK